MNEKLFFGTDGIRGNANQFPFTQKALLKLGRTFARWAQKTGGKNNPAVLIAHDTRSSASRIFKSLCSGLTQEGVRTFYGGVLSTPALQIALQHIEEASWGIMISASHNPASDNGIKLFHKNRKFTSDEEEEIVSIFEKLPNSPRLNNDIGCEYKDFQQLSTSLYLATLEKQISSFSLSTKKIVIDCAHGATFQLAQHALEKVGGTLILCNATPTGDNINDQCGSLYPSFLQKKVIEEKADIGFAFDGDGDRIIAVNAKGEIKEGDDLLALLLSHPSFQELDTVVGTVMTNYGFEKFLGQRSKNLVRTPVGDKYIAAKLVENDLLLGGENSGHIIIKPYLLGGDSLFVALKILETIALTNNWEMQTFEKYPQCLINIPIQHKDKLENQRYAAVIRHYEKQLIEGRLLVRFSGTENVLRIMSEDTDEARALSVGHALAEELQKLLEKDIIT